jgi:hypothetical protein
MKFIDLIKEPSDDKLLKKAKTIFSVLRKGKITRSDGVSFSYELGGRTFAKVHEGEIVLIGSVTSIKELTYCPINEKFMTELIEKKFDMFDINVELRPPNEDQIEKYQGKKPWEKDELNEEMDIDKERKRVKTIHKAIRKGIMNFDGNRYRYELPEEYTFHMVDELHLQVTAIKFTFYNKDLSRDNEGGHGLPLKIWRIEDGKDVYLNKILSPQDVGDICYNDEYNINTKTGVEYVNVKNKVRNKYRDFNINAIMTTPSDTVMVNESTDDHTQKQIKKAKTIYKALKKGTIGGDNPEEPHFTYVLSDDFSVHTTNAGTVISLYKIKIKHLNRGCLLHSTDYMGSLIRKRFNLFGIILTNPYKDLYFDYEVDDWESPINEGAEVLNSESLTKNEVRKVKTLYKLLKKGHFKYDDARSTYGYILPENYYIYKDELGDICIKLTGEEETKMLSKVKMARPSDNFDILILPEYTNLHDWIKNKVIEKFERFNIKFIF